MKPGVSQGTARAACTVVLTGRFDLYRAMMRGITTYAGRHWGSMASECPPSFLRGGERNFLRVGCSWAVAAGVAVEVFPVFSLDSSAAPGEDGIIMGKTGFNNASWVLRRDEALGRIPHFFCVLAQFSMGNLDIMSSSSLFWQTPSPCVHATVHGGIWKNSNIFHVKVHSDPGREVALLALGYLDITSTRSS